MDVNNDCFYNIANSNETFGLESSSEVATALSLGCIRWADNVEMHCGSGERIRRKRVWFILILILIGLILLLKKEKY